MSEDSKFEPIIKSIPKKEIIDFGNLSPFIPTSSPRHLTSSTPFPFNKDLSGLPSLDRSQQPPIPLERVIENLGRLGNQGQPGEEKLREIFEIKGNSPPSNAKLTYLCESLHRDIRAGLPIIQYLMEVPREGDVVLVEGYPAGEEVDRAKTERFGAFPEGVAIKGWDNMRSFVEGNKLHDELERINIELQSPQIPEEEKVTLRIYKNGDLLPRIQRTVIKKRNQSLMQTIEALRQENTDRRIFVVLGVNHIDKDPELLQYSEKVSYAILKTRV